MSAYDHLFTSNRFTIPMRTFRSHGRVGPGLIGIWLLLSAATLCSQDLESPKLLNRAAQYFLGKEDEVLIQVNILGYVQKPGQYFIPRYTNLLALISSAGGVQKGASLSNVQIMRAVKPGQGANGSDSLGAKHDKITVNLKKYFDTGETRYVPVLEAGDFVIIKQSSGDKWRNFLGVNSVISVMAATATLIYALDRF